MPSETTLLPRTIHDGSSPFDKAQGPEHSRGTKSLGARSSGSAAESEAYLVKREALEAGAKHEALGSGTKYASRTTFHASKTLHAQEQQIGDCSKSAMNHAG